MEVFAEGGNIQLVKLAQHALSGLDTLILVSCLMGLVKFGSLEQALLGSKLVPATRSSAVQRAMITATFLAYMAHVVNQYWGNRRGRLARRVSIAAPRLPKLVQSSSSPSQKEQP